jgi:hypothetical protein
LFSAVLLQISALSDSNMQASRQLAELSGSLSAMQQHLTRLSNDWAGLEASNRVLRAENAAMVGALTPFMQQQDQAAQHALLCASSRQGS